MYKRVISSLTVFFFLWANVLPVPGVSVLLVRQASAESIRRALPVSEDIFVDGFESGDTSAWSDAVDTDRYAEEPVTDVAASPTAGAVSVNRLIQEAAAAARRAQAQSEFARPVVSQSAEAQWDQFFQEQHAFRDEVNNFNGQIDQLFQANADLYGYVNGLERVTDQNAIDFNRQNEIMANQLTPMIKQSQNKINRAVNVQQQLEVARDGLTKTQAAKGPAGFALQEMGQKVGAAKTAFAEFQTYAQQQGYTLGGRVHEVDGFLAGIDDHGRKLNNYVEDQEAYLRGKQVYLEQAKNAAGKIKNQAAVQKAYLEQAQDFFRASKITSDSKHVPEQSPFELVRAGEHDNEDDVCQGLDENWYSFETCDDKCDLRPCIYKG
ncbi:MAG: hypothetical protein K8I00_07150, partial [Candidatus Omnitrophica bacterium]|nr:hypothetical protein [Candidatus Omnitrophota bacterium]